MAKRGSITKKPRNPVVPKCLTHFTFSSSYVHYTCSTTVIGNLRVLDRPRDESTIVNLLHRRYTNCERKRGHLIICTTAPYQRNAIRMLKDLGFKPSVKFNNSTGSDGVILWSTTTYALANKFKKYL